MRAALKRSAARLPGPLRRRIVGPAYRLHQRARSRRGRAEEQHQRAADGLPLPPSEFRSLVSAWDDTGVWLRSGEVDAGLLRRVVEPHGGHLTEMAAILDFGCGCGRIARWWATLDGPEIHGCDYNPDLAGWCERNLEFMNATVNGADPPTNYPPDQFDFIYAVSLFTHLPLAAQRSWLIELRRILRPGGHLLFTVMGERFRPQLDPTELRAFAAGEPVVRFPEARGGNLCSAFHPPSFVRNELLPEAQLELVDWVDEDRSGQNQSISAVPLQDNWLVRKP